MQEPRRRRRSQGVPESSLVRTARGGLLALHREGEGRGGRTDGNDVTREKLVSLQLDPLVLAAGHDGVGLDRHGAELGDGAEALQAGHKYRWFEEEEEKGQTWKTVVHSKTMSMKSVNKE